MKAWREFSDRLGTDTIRQFLAHSADHLYGLYEELQQSEVPSQLISHFESLMESLVSDARQLEREREKFDQAIRREREQHQVHLKNLEEELEIQVQRVAQVVKNEAEIKCEAEKRTLQHSLESEIAQLQTHLRLFQKVLTLFIYFTLAVTWEDPLVSLCCRLDPGGKLVKSRTTGGADTGPAGGRREDIQ